MISLIPKITPEFDTLKEVDEVIALGKAMSFKKGEYLCREGERQNHMYYLISGLVKCSYILEDKEVILRLMCDNSLVLAYSAFITGELASENIQALSDCEGVLIPINKLEKLRKDKPNVEMIFRFTAEKHYLSLERRLMMLHHKQAEQRYQFFCDYMEEKIVKETPSNQIASYLGITPESFSRVKRNLNK